MKVSFVSTTAIAQALRYSTARMQGELVTSQQEATTGKTADPGLKLGSENGKLVALGRDVQRLEGLVTANKAVAARLTSTQDGLSQLASSAQSFLGTLTAAIGGDASRNVILAAGRNALESATSVLNTSFNGEQLFGGVNTDIRPIEAYATAPASAGKQAMDAAFQSYFGFAPTDAAASSITGTQISDFIANELEPMFLGSGWSGTWSNATDQGITSRIALNETAETSVSANESGIRRLMMASAIVTDLMALPLGEGAVKAVSQAAMDQVTQSIGELGELQSRTGVIENRVSNATARLETQVDLFKTHVNALEDVDPYEASMKVNTLLSQIEASYTLTSRISQLSLLKFLS